MSRSIGVLGEHNTVSCASCHHGWDVNYLVRDLGRFRLRGEGFAFVWFDDDAIMVNWCPECERPETAGVQPLLLAA